MATHVTDLDPGKWMQQPFSSKTACEGGMLCRKVRDVESLVGLETFRREIPRRGHIAVENSGHVVVFCNHAPITRL